MPHKLREIDVSMVKVVSTVGRAVARDPTFGEFVPRLGISATFGEKFGELRYLGNF